jgi:hypothetical protein
VSCAGTAVHRSQREQTARAITVYPYISKSPFFCNVYLRPEMNCVATNRVPEVVSDLSYDFKNILKLYGPRRSARLHGNAAENAAAQQIGDNFIY